MNLADEFQLLAEMIVDTIERSAAKPKSRARARGVSNG
jgi:hypothetical protein